MTCVEPKGLAVRIEKPPEGDLDTPQVLITENPLDPHAVTALVEGPGNGAVVTFIGSTRDETGGRRVLHLEYEAYPEMAERMLSRVVAEILERWGIPDVAVAHRIGRLEIGEASLVAAVASPHRADAFAACAYIVDRIKEFVPIWKKEFFEDGSVWVGLGADEREIVAAARESG